MWGTVFPRSAGECRSARSKPSPSLQLFHSAFPVMPLWGRVLRHPGLPEFYRPSPARETPDPKPCFGHHAAGPMRRTEQPILDSVVSDVGRGDDTVGNPHRAQIYQFELFEPILLLNKDKQFPVEQFEATVSQSTLPSPPLETMRLPSCPSGWAASAP